MKVFCPNCGTSNDSTGARRMTCIACTASFDVAGETAPPPAPPVTAPAPAPPIMPTGYVGPPPTGFDIGVSQGGTTNPLAIVSLILGILCCFPFSVGAVITGFIAFGQISASQGQQKGQGLATAGIALGGIAILLNIVLFLVNLTHR